MTSKPKPKPAARKSLPGENPKAARKKPTVVRSAKPQALPKVQKPPAALPAKPKASEPVPAAELSADVMEFITAIDEYKRQRRRPFPSWSEIFEIVRALGYKKSA
jgi:hypothetical protein